MDTLENEIRHLWSNQGSLDRDEVVSILLSLCYRIRRLEARLNTEDE